MLIKIETRAMKHRASDIFYLNPDAITTVQMCEGEDETYFSISLGLGEQAETYSITDKEWARIEPLLVAPVPLNSKQERAELWAKWDKEAEAKEVDVPAQLSLQEEYNQGIIFPYPDTAEWTAQFLRRIAQWNSATKGHDSATAFSELETWIKAQIELPSLITEAMTKVCDEKRANSSRGLVPDYAERPGVYVDRGVYQALEALHTEVTIVYLGGDK